MTQQDVIRLWQHGAHESWIWAQKMHAEGSHALALFHCHLSLEKKLKSLYVKTKNDTPPFSHNLGKLALDIRTDWPKKVLEDLELISPFCQEARYGDEAWIETIATKEFVTTILQKTEELLHVLQ
ncbi:HEPN domain-containing protein [Candidatus Peregrinibacteria bacterium]|nr:HEPN domain-containing protein [Candidatus Peregrinibacteria bacterium]